ncbi:sensor domain-containing diguanylate cyclase [Neptunomonas antarctica]|uniref:diguanylate cyclase n=1 Tax=Neptunomonas antarctica TaxID=619304 RepID=A0A1N7J080_9GAMM|nr:diguanylate cyclase [Neptunomonas antarctica]SIS42667.1 diguanylate cyclase (GGDEF) domain-containing protein [Neptunomonas antarctica]
MKVLIICFWILLSTFSSDPTQAKSLTLTELPSGSLGNYTHYFIEDAKPLTLEEAIFKNNAGGFRAGKQEALNFGIDSPPVWLTLTVNNSTDQPLAYQLAVGTTWIDQLNISILQNSQLIRSWQAGDALPNTPSLIPGTGFIFTQPFPPGVSEIYIRAATQDPLILPIKLTPLEKVAGSSQWTQYGYGFLYGYLCALIAYNLILYSRLRKRSYLYYLLYLASFILTNLAYTGHGYAWLWPTHPEFQRYIILALMVLYSSCSLIFACRFLSLKKHAPRLLRWIRNFILLGPCLIGLTILQNNQLYAVLVAFSYLTASTLGLVLLGIFAVWKKQAVGRYFFAAAFFGMCGTAVTTFAVLGWIPFTPLTFHSVDIGIPIEATLLALALTHQVREQQDARMQAEYMARHDPLTGLLNRRGFHYLASNIWSTAIRKHRITSIIMLDMDHFKQINDQYGHAIGDQVLVGISQLLASECRAQDLLARWGGEEFILLLPETPSEQACIFAERIRIAIETFGVNFKQANITTTVSLGIAQSDLKQTLDELIHEADKHLYLAKDKGRNQIHTTALPLHPLTQ